jgi:hypothetical protein
MGMRYQLQAGSDGHAVPPAYADLADEYDDDEDTTHDNGAAYQDMRKSG